MSAVIVIVRNVCRREPPEVFGVEPDEVVKEFAAHGAHKPLGVPVHPCFVCERLGFPRAESDEIAETVAWLTLNSRRRSSPWMRGAPQVVFSSCRRWIAWRVGRAIGCGPFDFEPNRQNARKPARCPRRTVSRVTIARTFRHACHHRRSAIWREPVSIGEARALRPQSSELLAECDVGDEEFRERSAYDD